MASPEKKVEHLLALTQLEGRASRSEEIARALRTAILLLDADAAIAQLASARGKGDRFVLYAGSDTPAALPPNVEGSEAMQALQSERQALLVPDHSDNPSLAASDPCPGVEAGPVLFVPVDLKGGLPAYLAVYRRRGRAKYTANETELMLLLASWLSTTLENHRLAASAEKMLLTDETTQIYNARFVKSALTREVKRGDRHGQELALIRIEIDQVESFRAEHGNAKTTRMMKDVAQTLSKCVRSFDVLGKDGDTGFMAILPQTANGDAHEVAERMRAAIASCAFAPASVGAITATFGLASFPHEGHEVPALLAVADRALEQGRTKGGNCVATATKKAA
jgi:diguanylate cyclase (GGDEF)-like protein